MIDQDYNRQASRLQPLQALIPKGKVEELLTQSEDIAEQQINCE